ncbi:hypothetical protein Q5H91_12820 [Sphingomonas sp. KR1UV-12]|uniref:MFS transporter n=1 Tax=Sphingomonas aurea TaxID=3063994 RepID=A0ABT9EMA5_9SPHN|nr:MFS transporter [Sphingomonas sp. KR1UV-12]MDP1028098.1 hypothetical protein [Sphingomonas sp. KR1UV-12]
MTLTRANAVLEFVRSVGMLIGPIAGGMLVAWGGTSNALLLDAASFVVLAVIVLGSGLRRPAMTPAESERATLWREYLPFLRDTRITAMIGSLTLAVYGTAIADVAFVFLVTVSLAAGPTAFGVLTACWAGGMMAGAAAAGTLRMPHSVPVAFAAAVVMGAATLAIGIVGTTMALGIAVIGIAFLFGGAANSVYNVAVRTTLQREASAGAHGKVAALYSAATNGAGVFGFLTGGLFTPDHATSAYVLGGSICIIAGLGGWLIFPLSRAGWR